MVDGRLFRVVFFGTPAFAVPTLDALLASRHAVVGVVSQPDRPRGRGHHVSDSPVKARALAARLPVVQPEKLRDADTLAALTELHADIGVVAAYGKILTEAVLAIPAKGMLNVHASLLPRYRGAAPVHRAIIAGERETGVTIMRVVRALDAGPMLATAYRDIGDAETSDEVERELASLGASLLVSTLDRLASDPVVETPQDEAAATYAPRLTKEDGAIDWSRSARDLHNLIRGLHPWPHAYTSWRGRRLILLRSASEDYETHATAGTVVTAHGDDLHVAAGSGVVRILDLQAEGKRPMTAREFLAGHHIAPGEALTKPTSRS
jgi:methionyl-tRNA formyltransferase